MIKFIFVKILINFVSGEFDDACFNCLIQHSCSEYLTPRKYLQSNIPYFFPGEFASAHINCAGRGGETCCSGLPVNTADPGCDYVVKI